MTMLRQPPDKFWPWEVYKAKFGNPKDPANVKLGHRSVNISGHKGVTIPWAAGDEPCPRQVARHLGHMHCR